MDVPRNTLFADMLNDPMHESANADLIQPILDRVNEDNAFTPSAKGAYQAFLGYYLGQLKRLKLRSKTELVETANELSRSMGLKEIPKMTRKLVRKMGLDGVPGIVIGEDDAPARGGGGRGGPPNGRAPQNGGRGDGKRVHSAGPSKNRPRPKKANTTN
jgi:hypothetical protein